MSDFFKNLKSLFIVEESVPESQAHAETTASEGTDTGQKTSTADIVDEGKVSSRFVDVLLDAMAKSNLEGIDYLEYRQSLDSLGKMEMDEGTRFRSAFAMAQTMGATVEKLVNSAGHYLQVLEEERKKFQQALQKHSQLKVERRQRESEELAASVAELKRKIREYNEQIRQQEERIDQLAKEMGEAEGRIAGTSNNFEASYEFVSERIRQDIGKIKEFLK